MNNHKFQVTTKLAFYISCMIFTYCSLSACSSNKETPEQQINQFVNTAKEMAESRDINGIANLISEHYTDEKKRNKQAISQIVTGYFWRYKNIHVFTRINNLDFPKPASAELQLLVAMADLPISSVDSLLDSRARLYQFDLVLKREETDWTVVKASWRPATTKDFFEN